METQPHNRTPHRKQGRGKRILLQLLAVVVVAASCTIAVPLLANAAQGQQQVQNTGAQSTQVEAAGVISHTPTEDGITADVATGTAPVATATSAPSAPAPSPSEPGAAPVLVAVANDRARLQPDALGFIAATTLPAQPEFAHLFGQDVQGLFVTAPTYVEPVAAVGGQLRVDRIIDYELAPGVCTNTTNRQTLGDLCFAVDTTADYHPRDCGAYRRGPITSCQGEPS